MSAARTVVGVTLLGLALWAQPSWADSAFARILDSKGVLIPGDQVLLSDVPEALNAIKLISTGFGLDSPAGGTHTIQPLVLTKFLDRASPRLLVAAAMGEPLTVEIVWYRTDGARAQRTTSVKLLGAVIVGLAASASLDNNSMAAFEQVKLSYARLTLSVPGPDGKLVTGCLDVATGKTC
jgi:hypothetical protein